MNPGLDPALLNSLSLVDLYPKIHEACNTVVPDAVDACENDMPALAQMLSEHRQAIQSMKLAEDYIVSKLVPLIPYGGAAVEGVGQLEVRGGTTRKGYDQPLLISAFAKRIGLEASAEILGTTEPPEQLRMAIEYAVTTMAKAAGATAPSFTSWRSGVAKSLGIKLDDYAAEREPSQKTVIIR